jgi:hypothetical protein
LAEEGLSAGWHTPWTWPARPPDDLNASICAAACLALDLSSSLSEERATPSENDDSKGGVFGPGQTA